MTSPSAKINDGKSVAATIRAECKARDAALISKGVAPGLAVVLVGTDPASAVYVRNKIRACEEVGIRSVKRVFPATVGMDELLEAIRALSDDPSIHGILVQLPLPKELDTAAIVKAIPVELDVDGFHLNKENRLGVGGTVFPPCTPYGVVKMLEHEGISVDGKDVVVVGASSIV